MVVGQQNKAAEKTMEGVVKKRGSSGKKNLRKG